MTRTLTNGDLRAAHGFTTDTTFTVYATDYATGRFSCVYREGSRAGAWEAARQARSTYPESYAVDVLRNEGSMSTVCHSM